MLFLTCRGYVGIHSSGFRDFLLKPELLRAIVDSGFEHPSEGKLSIYLNLLFNLQLLLLAVVAVCDDFEDFRFVMVIVIIVLKYLLGFFICSEIVWRPLFSVTILWKFWILWGFNFQQKSLIHVTCLSIVSSLCDFLIFIFQVILVSQSCFGELNCFGNAWKRQKKVYFTYTRFLGPCFICFITSATWVHTSRKIWNGKNDCLCSLNFVADWPCCKARLCSLLCHTRELAYQVYFWGLAYEKLWNVLFD